MSELLLTLGVLSQPVQHQLAEVSKENEAIPADVVWNVYRCLLGGIQTQIPHRLSQVLGPIYQIYLTQQIFSPRPEWFPPQLRTLKYFQLKMKEKAAWPTKRSEDLCDVGELLFGQHVGVVRPHPGHHQLLLLTLRLLP